MNLKKLLMIGLIALSVGIITTLISGQVDSLETYIIMGGIWVVGISYILSNLND